jgi:hypothetical protein
MNMINVNVNLILRKNKILTYLIMGFFKKLANQSSNFFKKAGGDASNLFKKAETTVTKTANTVGGGIVQGANVVGTGLRKVGNTLEKAAPIAAEVGAGVAMLAGQPELAVPLMSAGMAAQRLGGQAKQIGQQVKQAGTVGQQMTSRTAGAFTGTLADANSKLQTANASLTNRLDQAASMSLGPSNQLAQIHNALQ